MDRLIGRRGFLAGLFAVAATVVTAPVAEAYNAGDFFFLKPRRKRRALAARVAPRRVVKQQAKRLKGKAGKIQKLAAKDRKKRKSIRDRYNGAAVVSFASNEKRGTLIIKTSERALYQVLGGGKAMRYLVAVGKEGFSWSGVARVGAKAVNPPWTPPPEMIERSPKFARWADGMPGGLPENPLGVRALYLYNKSGDTGFRIHGTISPNSIGTAASSGCIRMLNEEVIRLYDQTPRGTKVIVI
jgi:lipoprotein-anchoring transpeptidase ErfK/SrfK